MTFVVDVDVINDAFKAIVCTSHERQREFLDALCNAIDACDAAKSREMADAKDIVAAYDLKHNASNDHVESDSTAFRDNAEYRVFRYQEARIDNLLADESRQALFPIEHLMFMNSPKSHPVSIAFRNFRGFQNAPFVIAGIYRSIKVEVGRCVAYCVLAYPTAQAQVAAINKLYEAVLASPSAKSEAPNSTANPSIGFLMAAVHGLFRLMFEKDADVSGAARAAIASIWKETVMLSEVGGSAQLLQLQELYVQRTELSERRQVLRMLDEVTNHDLRRGLDSMLDLLTLDDELDTSTAVDILPDVLATAQRLFPNRSGNPPGCPRHRAAACPVDDAGAPRTLSPAPVRHLRVLPRPRARHRGR
ncbi:Hypothetical protein, putative, partial [Bodo saltans]